MAKRFRIHPAIGIARVGTSQEVFLAPELPGTFARATDDSYRDGSGKLRRQATRFRVFEYDDANPNAEPVEINVATGLTRVEWTVHLANQKAGWFAFDGVVGEGPAGYPAGHPLRNAGITDPAERQRRLVIDPGPRTIVGINQTVEISQGSGGGFPETWPGPLAAGKQILSLGTLQTDDSGRLIAAGGFGTSGTTGALPPNGQLAYDNNDEWFDDVSDGPVTANLVFADGSTRPVDDSAWLIVAPPDYAPPIENLVTLHDLLYDLALRNLALDPGVFDPLANQFAPGFVPSFTRHVYPVLRRAFDYRWVNQSAGSHQPPHFDFTTLSLPRPVDETPATNPRFRIFNRLRNPGLIDDPANPQRTMPRLHNDGIGGFPPESLRFTVTPTQYEIMRLWSTGQFGSDWVGPPPPDTVVTASGLDRATLEAGCGGSFFPGMEASWNMRDPAVYSQPFGFRFRHAANPADATGLRPGDVTKRSALPWQADFLKCANNWWPTQRPNQVRPAPGAAGSVDWARGIANHVDLVERWSQLGIVRPAAAAGSVAKYHESERTLP